MHVEGFGYPYREGELDMSHSDVGLGWQEAFV